MTKMMEPVALRLIWLYLLSEMALTVINVEFDQICDHFMKQLHTWSMWYATYDHAHIWTMYIVHDQKKITSSYIYL